MFEYEGNTYSLTHMLDANAADPELCVWLKQAKSGDRYDADPAGVVICLK